MAFNSISVIFNPAAAERENLINYSMKTLSVMTCDGPLTSFVKQLANYNDM